MMPAYNAGGTIAMALASLVAQTYPRWQCIVVDDGSDDETAAVARGFGDPRIIVLQLPENRGRGVARQAAIERSEGSLLAMLDADDWYHPAKLQRQVAVMLEDPDLTLVATGLAVVDDDGVLLAARVRGGGQGGVTVAGPVRELGPAPVSHATCLLRADHAGALRYDPRFRLAQDSDFLVRLLLDRRYAVIGEPLYMYAEPGSVTEAKVLAGLSYSLQLFAKHHHRFPWQSRREQAKTWGKLVAYRGLFALGLKDWLIARRSRPPTPEERAAHAEALYAVRQALPAGHRA